MAVIGIAFESQIQVLKVKAARNYEILEKPFFYILQREGQYVIGRIVSRGCKQFTGLIPSRCNAEYIF